MRVPLEILDRIVLELASSANGPPQYGYQPCTLAALLQLCQVNHTMSTIAGLHLYSTVVIHGAHQLSLFNRTISSPSTHLQRYTKSISLHDFPGALSPPYSLFLNELLHSISPYLRRLVLSRSLRQLCPEYDAHAVRPALRTALESCTLLEEFASVQCELYLDDSIPHSYVCWPYWTSLRRLALHNPLIDRNFLAFIGALRYLSHLAIDNPDWDEPLDITLMMSLLELSNPMLKNVILTDHRLRSDNEDQNKQVHKYIGSIRGLELVYMVLWYIDGDCNMGGHNIDKCWFRDHLDAGTLWEFQPSSLN